MISINCFYLIVIVLLHTFYSVLSNIDNFQTSISPVDEILLLVYMNKFTNFWSLPFYDKMLPSILK